jgi:hypothetical protein
MREFLVGDTGGGDVFRRYSLRRSPSASLLQRFPISGPILNVVPPPDTGSPGAGWIGARGHPPPGPEVRLGRRAIEGRSGDGSLPMSHQTLTRNVGGHERMKCAQGASGCVGAICIQQPTTKLKRIDFRVIEVATVTVAGSQAGGHNASCYRTFIT